MRENFLKALAFVRQAEGGNDDDPDDPGGRTSRGITQREYNAWRHLQDKPSADVWQATEQEINAIYHEEYWNPYCDSLPGGTDYLYFDMAVNAGPHRAAILLQRALGVADDGHIGPITKMAAKNVTDFAGLVKAFDAKKRAFYLSLHNAKYIKGWLNRCDQVVKNALSLVKS